MTKLNAKIFRPLRLCSISGGKRYCCIHGGGGGNTETTVAEGLAYKVTKEENKN